MKWGTLVNQLHHFVWAGLGRCNSPPPPPIRLWYQMHNWRTHFKSSLGGILEKAGHWRERWNAQVVSYHNSVNKHFRQLACVLGKCPLIAATVQLIAQDLIESYIKPTSCCIMSWPHITLHRGSHRCVISRRWFWDASQHPQINYKRPEQC